MPAPRSLAFLVFVAIAFVTLGRPPGALRLRTEEVEGFIASAGKAARDQKLPSGWVRVD